MNKRLIRRLLPAVLILLLCASAIAVLMLRGILVPNSPSREEYPVRGVDVSHYQGTIHWETLTAQEISFAFIKATEGSSYVDERFAYNYTEARKTGLAVGAYHFFSFDSPGSTQAEHFISTVEAFDGMLPPVVDLEFYGNKALNPPTRTEVTPELQALLAALESHYGKKPILYTTEIVYSLYLSGDYADYDIWIRDVNSIPSLPDGRDWTFWQYTDRARLNGYDGKERYIDMNAFHGSATDFEAYRNTPASGKSAGA